MEWLFSFCYKKTLSFVHKLRFMSNISVLNQSAEMSNSSYISK